MVTRACASASGVPGGAWIQPVVLAALPSKERPDWDDLEQAADVVEDIATKGFAPTQMIRTPGPKQWCPTLGTTAYHRERQRVCYLPDSFRHLYRRSRRPPTPSRRAAWAQSPRRYPTALLAAVATRAARPLVVLTATGRDAETLTNAPPFVGSGCRERLRGETL